MMNLNMTMQNNRAYLGADGLKNYLKPKADEYIPLVNRLQEIPCLAWGFLLKVWE